MIAMVKRNAHKGIPVLFVTTFVLGVFLVFALGRFRLEWALTALCLGGSAALLVTDGFLSKLLIIYYFRKSQREQLQSIIAFLLFEGLLSTFIPFTGFVLDGTRAVVLQIIYGGSLIVQFMYAMYLVLAVDAPEGKTWKKLFSMMGFLIANALIAVLAISDVVLFVVRLFT